MEFMVNCYNKSDHKLSWEGKMIKTIRKTAIVMLLFVYFLTYGVLPQVLYRYSRQSDVVSRSA